jgi:hypothetical protein
VRRRGLGPNAKLTHLVRSRRGGRPAPAAPTEGAELDTPGNIAEPLAFVADVRNRDPDAEAECTLWFVPRSSWILIVLLAVPTAARADVVEPGYRPRQRPPGAWGGFPHGRGPCTAHPCSDDRACFGNVCVSTALCLEGNEVISECGAGDICARGRCERAHRCAPKERVGAPSGRHGCHCSGPASRGGGLGPSLLTLVAVLAARRRRRR